MPSPFRLVFLVCCPWAAVLCVSGMPSQGYCSCAKLECQGSLHQLPVPPVFSSGRDQLGRQRKARSRGGEGARGFEYQRSN
ncbi:uncharacterized protein B0I36DRAFT_318340, partial [Microdochium trichocladiopsis]